jgi:hypothetical protein
MYATANKSGGHSILHQWDDFEIQNHMRVIPGRGL